MPAADNIFDTIDRMRRAGRPFCVATVVRTADATSAKAGAKAVIAQDGTIEGHLGGACVRRAVRDAAEAALARGTTQLIRVKPVETVTAPTDADGVRLYGSGCPSGGTVDLLVEAYHPPPVVLVFGATGIAREVAAQATRCGFRVVVADGHAPALAARDYAVVAAQGEGDTDALRAALRSGAGRVSMVASRRKAETLLARLAAQGETVDPARLKSPAGLDIGAIDPAEIALSIVAELVAWRRGAAAS